MEENNAPESFHGHNKEVRFAVVMYGGVSLAIYINGVAQELLKMCRSTKAAEKKLSSTEKIYRQIGAILANDKLLEALLKLNDDDKIEAEINKTLNEHSPTVKFVVDVLTGTSAGGINAIFLAKALANNQDMAKLKELWIKEGDIGLLLNDKKSVADNDLEVPDKAKSLLNSDRMFIKLIEAFEGMGDDSADDNSLVDEIDLFVPTTDFKGVIVPLRLLDGVVEEKSFRQVFHFRYDKNDKTLDADGNESSKNDFTKAHNPMLGFASRATSSFPFAFEPMRLKSALSVIEQCFEDGKSKAQELKADCETFFPYIVEKNGEKVDWENRDLIDGGVLDNKPFTHAINVLSKRRADFQVERKLLYIEPSPESFKNSNRQNSGKAPDVLENAVASLSSIPGYETIREDLEKLFERNRLIERVNSIISLVEQDVFRQLTAVDSNDLYVSEKGNETGKWWEKQGLEDIAKWKGRAVLSYYRLRIAALTDEITRVVTQLLGIDENSEYFSAVRDLIKAWRTDKYKDYKNPTKETVLAFLRNYDLIYRLRRLRLVQQKASRLYFFDKDFSEEIKTRSDKFADIRTRKEDKLTESEKENILVENDLTENPFIEESIEIPFDIEENLRIKLNLTNELETKKAGSIERKPSEILSMIGENNKEIGENNKENVFRKQVQPTVDFFQKKLGEVYKDLQNVNKEILSKNGEIFKEVEKLSIKLKEKHPNQKTNGEEPNGLKNLLNLTERYPEKTDTGTVKENPAWANFKDEVSNIAEKLEAKYKEVFDQARNSVNELWKMDLENLPVGSGLTGVNPIIFNAVLGYLKHYYTNFDEYDQMSFPIFYQTQVGEAAKVDVLRISPIDATSLIDEKKSGRQKVAGESLFHFGAFLDRTWRWNDIMWGRLDGAERLITALLPDEKYKTLRAFFTRKIHLIILDEELRTANLEQVRATLAESLAKASSDPDLNLADLNLQLNETIRKVTKDLSDDVIKTRLEKVLKSIFSTDEAYSFVKDHYEVDKNLDPQSLLRIISRSTKITGDIFEGIADKHGVAGDRFRLISRLGQVFWGLVEVAAPNSVWNMLLGHWLVLLYFFEFLLIAASTIFVKPEIQQFATVLLVLTLILHLSAVTLHDYMRGGKILYLLRFFAIGILGILVSSGALSFYAFFYDGRIWGQLNNLHQKLIALEIFQNLIPLALLVTLFIVIFTWRDSKNPNLKYYGTLTLIYVGLVGILVVVMAQLAPASYGIDNLCPILLENLGTPNRQGLKTALLVDSFLFVPLYTGFLLFFTGLFNLWRNNLQGWKKALMTIAAILVFCAALSDLTENYFSYVALSTKIFETESCQINTIHYSTMTKWLTLSLVTAVLSLMFWRKNWWKLFTYGFSATAILGIIGLFEQQFIQYFLAAQIILLVIVSFLFLAIPQTFKRENS